MGGGLLGVLSRMWKCVLLCASLAISSAASTTERSQQALEFWLPAGTPRAYGPEYKPLGQPNASCELLVNQTYGSLFGEGVWDPLYHTLRNGTYCEQCTWLPGVEAPIMTDGLPCHTIYGLVTITLFLVTLLFLSAIGAGSKSEPNGARLL